VLHLLLYGVLAILLGGVLFAAGARFLPAGEQIAPPVRDEPPWELPPDRAIRAEDVDAVRLPVALRGYRFAETDQLLDRLAGELRARDAELARLRGEVRADEGAPSEEDASAEDGLPTAEQLPFDEPVGEPVGAGPVDAAPVDEEPVGEPVGAAPVDAAPVEEEPVDAAPVDEEPVHEEPVDVGAVGVRADEPAAAAEEAITREVSPAPAEHDDELADSLAVDEALDETPPRAVAEPAAEPDDEPQASAAQIPAASSPAAQRAASAAPVEYLAPVRTPGAEQPAHWTSTAPPWAVGPAPWLTQEAASDQPAAQADGHPADAAPAEQPEEFPKRTRRRRKRS
jgi:hypothetical protein